jgi:Asp-tRNA(Asn)/Glu-tRNA(Gln) amidotransferase A subunit family amidase
MLPTIHEAAALIRAGKTSSRELLETCLANIDRYEDRVRAWVLVDRDRARAEAKAADDELARGHDRGPLHGIPVAIKDIFDVFDWPTACGSRLWANAIARQDAPVVAKLRHAGAVLIGKTVTTAFASFDPPVTRNPWDLSRTPGGSSSGSAAAIACGMCFAALASQTGGSITRPASYCGVAGCKPSYGVVSVDGVMPLAPSLDHVGAMARTVGDVALVMQTIRETDDISWLPRPFEYGDSLLVGRVRGLFERLASHEMNAMMDATFDSLRRAGATVEELGLPAEFEEVIAQHRVIMAVEAAAFHEKRFLRHPEDYAPKIASLIEEGLACPAPVYARAKQLQDQLRQSFRPQMRTLICPATTTAAPDAATTGDPAFNSPWSFLGLPAVSIPVGLTATGLPLAIQLIGWHEAEWILFMDATRVERLLAVNLGTPRALA